MSITSILLAIYIIGAVIAGAIVLKTIDETWEEIAQETAEKVDGKKPTMFHWTVVFLLLALGWPFFLVELLRRRN